MAIDRVGLRFITPDTVPASLGWDYLEPHLHGVDPLELSGIEHAFNVAMKLHKDHPPRDTGGPYIEHPTMVLRYLADAGCTDPSTLKGGSLHDGPEDHMKLLVALGLTSIPDMRLGPYVLLAKHFGGETADIVYYLTKPDLENRTPRQKYQMERAYRARLLDEGSGGTDTTARSKARLIKLSDRLHNRFVAI